MYDVHTHAIPPQVMRWLQDNHHKVNAQWKKKDPLKAEFLSVNGKWEFELKEVFTNQELYLQEQAKAGISFSLVSAIPQLFLYECEPELTKELASVYNDGLIDWSGQNPERLSALATLPLNDPSAAALELERVMKCGAKGAIVASSWAGRGLTESDLTPMWEVANAYSAIIFVHPLLCEDQRLRKTMMANLIGVPWETTICATDLLLSGIMERYPKVKVLLAHGGGFFPYQIGRIQTGYEKWTAVSSNITESPRQALCKFWYDSVLWNADSLQYLVELVGRDRVVPGTDYPFDLCEWPPAHVGSDGFRSLMNNN
ncbi:amidohydrolase family protein [Cohnella sp. WQ 127256]|uniref:amidohydrolase family protein n=1 Tax=Cohnella sp. WQ 127256 TaxID=2938790 RepID=UPI0021191D1D|nr:amidohydrolase family protein [Cohnella sp. WQ 127256]